MRCYCCDKLLTDAEVQYIPNSKKFEVCSICLDIAMDTAYSDGFVRPDDADAVEVLEPDSLRDDFTTFSPLVLYGTASYEGYVD